ncbi:hypothetical protein BLAT2472_20777 [Burkholderia latens]
MYPRRSPIHSDTNVWGDACPHDAGRAVRAVRGCVPARTPMHDVRSCARRCREFGEPRSRSRARLHR